MRGNLVGGMGLTAAVAAVVALAAAPALTPTSVWAAGANDRLEVEGRTLFFKGEYQKALDIYANLLAETGDPLYLRNVGRCHQKLLQPDKAIEAFREYLRRGRKVKPAEREEIAEFIKEMEALKAKQDAERAAAAKPERPVAPVATEPPPAPKQPPASAAPAAVAVAVTPLPRADGAPPGATSPAPTGMPPGADLSAQNTAPAPDTGTDDSQPITRKWWFWTGIGALIVGGVVTAVVLGQGGGAGEPPCPTSATCPLD